MTNRILITGCSHGLGRALACEFDQLGCITYAVGRDKLKLYELADTSKKIQPIVADIKKKEGRDTIYQQIHNEPLSIIHNAAIAIPSQFSEDNELLREHMETNFFAPLCITKQLLPFLVDQRVLTITSGAANFPLAGLMPYCASKSAIQLATQCLAIELKSRGIYFGNLSPGMIDTHMQHQLRNSNEKTLPNRKFYSDAFENGKLTPPEVVAKFVSWVMLKTNHDEFSAKIWNINDKSHHLNWLPKNFNYLFSD